MSVREFSTKLNSLAKYAPSMANSERGKLDVFIKGLRPNIVMNVVMRDNPPKNFLKALSHALRFKTMSQCMARDKELLEEPTPPTWCRDKVNDH